MNTILTIRGTNIMRQVRYGLFETNSSSTHSLIIANDKEYKQLLDGELFVSWDGNFITREQVINSLLKCATEYNYNNDMLELLKEEFDIDVPAITREFLKDLSTDILDALCREFIDGIESYGSYMGSEYLDNYEETYVSEHGDKIHIFGLYGRDG